MPNLIRKQNKLLAKVIVGSYNCATVPTGTLTGTPHRQISTGSVPR
jgi:hypothetical protein